MFGTNKLYKRSFFRLLLLLVGLILYYTYKVSWSGEEKASVLDTKVKVFTVATDRTDSFLRYMSSARFYDIEVTPLGLGLSEGWKYLGLKVDLLREAVRPLKDENDTIILFTDSYDVVFTSGLAEIVQKFKESNSKLFFSAEKNCYPDESLATKYPSVESNASPYLNSGAFIGYAPQVWAAMKTHIANTDNDQLYYTKVFLDEQLRKELDIKLDIISTLFQNLFMSKDDIKWDVDLDTNKVVLKNINFLTTPSILHGNGGIAKVELNTFTNYLINTFSEDRVKLEETNLPIISLSIMITQAVPFFDMFLNKTAKLNYPKNKMHLFIYSGVEFHDGMAKSHLKQFENEYLSSKIVLSTDQFDEKRGRQLALQQAQQKNVDYIFFVDADVHIDDPEVLRELLSLDKQFAAPVVRKYNELQGNFWDVYNERIIYDRSPNYVDIVKGNIIGIWNVPYVSSIYLIKYTAFKFIDYNHKFQGQSYNPGVTMCTLFVENGVHMFITNDRIYGHLVQAKGFDTTVARPDFYTLFTNKLDWIKKYIHPNFTQQLESSFTYLQPCPDVYWFQIVTDAFCDDMVAIMENFGKWSDGSSKHERLEDGIEAVPTRNIHMKQVGLDALWLQFLDLFVRPLQEKVFLGNFHNPVSSLMNFVERYRPDEQPYLIPHHDSSNYTINIALNNAGIDYEGGGCRFLHYKCSVTATKKGWMLMHPGSLTHYHKGITNGTRYIMISFIDP